MVGMVYCSYRSNHSNVVGAYYLKADTLRNPNGKTLEDWTNGVRKGNVRYKVGFLYLIETAIVSVVTIVKAHIALSVLLSQYGHSTF